MEPLSTFPRRGHVSWQEIVLTVSLLTTWNLPVAVQLSIESVPFNATENGDVLLLAYNLPQDLLGFHWYRGKEIVETQRIGSYILQNTPPLNPGPAYRGRETLYPNGTLQIQNVTQADEGFYTLQTLNSMYLPQQASGQFRVWPVLLKPFITSNNSTPVEHEDTVTLTCGPEIQETTYQWMVNGLSLPNDRRLELSNDSRTLTVFNVTRNDTGPYVCVTSNPVSANRSDPFTLNVSYGPDTPVISPPESYFQTGISLNLSCNAASNPPAQYSWSFNESFLQSTQELFIHNITANNTGFYTCVAHNLATGRNSTAVKNVIVTEALEKPTVLAINTTVAEGNSVTLTCFSNHTEISIRWLFNNQSLQLTDGMTLSRNDSTLTIDPVTRENAGPYQCEVSNPGSISRSDPVTLTVTYPPSSPSSPEGLSPGAIAGIVIGVVAGVALIVVLVYFLFFRKTGRASDQRDLREHTLSASSNSRDPSEHSSTKMDEITYSSLNFNAQQPKQSPPDFLSSPTTETIYTEIKRN